MKIKVNSKKNIVIIDIIGDFIADCVTQFKEKADPLLSDDKIETIAINMNQVNYIDSTAIGSLVSIMKTAKGEKKDFLLYDLNTSVIKFFNDVGLQNFFKVINKEEFEAKYNKS